MWAAFGISKPGAGKVTAAGCDTFRSKHFDMIAGLGYMRLMVSTDETGVCRTSRSH
jgi:hypothetical protein